MTGSEIAAAGAVVKGAASAGKALQGGEKEQALILEAAKGSSGYVAAGVARGDRLAAKQLAINKLLSPLFWFAGYRRDYFESGQFAEDLAEKLDSVSEDDLTSPSPVVAAKAMEGLSYSLDEPDLKQMYLNLLGTASSRQRQGDAHPSFAEVIRQLSAQEASLLPQFLQNLAGEPAVEVRARNETGGFITLERHVVEIKTVQTEQQVIIPNWPVFVDNWTRLGLVEADYTSHRAAEGAYDFIEHRAEYVRHRDRADLPEGFSVTFEKGLLRATNFGLRFREAVTSATTGTNNWQVLVDEGPAPEA